MEGHFNGEGAREERSRGTGCENCSGGWGEGLELMEEKTFRGEI